MTLSLCLVSSTTPECSAQSSCVIRGGQYLIRLLVFTGVRRAELAALRWDDINFEDMTVRIRHDKGDKERLATIADSTSGTQDVLADLRDNQDGAYKYIFPRMTRGRSPDWGEDKPMLPIAVLRVVRTAADKAKLIVDDKTQSPHDLRRTFATKLLKEKVPLREVQEAMGHAQASTTLRYAQATDAAARYDLLKFE